MYYVNRITWEVPNAKELIGSLAHFEKSNDPIRSVTRCNRFFGHIGSELQKLINEIVFQRNIFVAD